MGKTKYFLLVGLAFLLGVAGMQAEHLVILTTNDTHSHIDPDFDGKGGVLRRKVLIDSVRCAEKNVMLVDAGDAVQGTLYFSEFAGAVEYPLLDMLGYDINIIGNHELDNGLADLTKYYKLLKTEVLSSNYDFSRTGLAGVFKPYTIREFAGRKIGFIALNLNPNGIISEVNNKGIVFSDIVETANAMAAMLKKEKGVDFVVMLSHIGYEMGDNDLADDIGVIESSLDIDLVIGGHTHTVVNPDKPKPAWQVANKVGRLIPVTQTGNLGKYIGLIDVDLETLKVAYRLLPVDKRYDSRINYPWIEAFLAPYKHRVDSLMNKEIAVSAKYMERRSLGALSNWTCDMARDIARKLSGIKIDCSILNKGGFRQSLPKGSVSEGLVNSIYPFENRLQVIELSGKQLIAALEVMAGRGGDATSSDLIVEFTKDKKIKSAKINGKNVKLNKKYKVATLDYLANGGDYMEPFKAAKRLFADDVKVSVRYLDYIHELTTQGKMIDAEDEPRMKLVEN